MLQRPLFVLALCLSACNTVATPGVSSPSPTATPVAPSPSPSVAVPGFPADFPRGNQRLATGDRLGSGFPINQLNAEGSGAVLWSGRDHSGQRFDGFRAVGGLFRHTLGSASVPKAIDANGNGWAFQTDFGSSIGFLESPASLRIWRVNDFITQGQGELRMGQSLIKLFADAEGEGWVLISEGPPEGWDYFGNTSPPPAPVTRLYRLQAGQILPDNTQVDPDLSQGDVLDGQGNGFRVYAEAQALWLQKIAAFQKDGAPIQLSERGEALRVQEHNGHGLISWRVTDAANRAVEMAFYAFANYLPTERLPSQALSPNRQVPELLASQLDADGTGLLVWREYVYPVGQAPQGKLSIQTVRQRQWGPEQLVRPTGDFAALNASVHLDETGRGLLVWLEQPIGKLSEVVLLHQDKRLQAIALTQGQLDGAVRLISEDHPGSVDGWSVRLTPAGHGLIAWGQFLDNCPQGTPCKLDQSVWARAVYGHRIP